MKPARLSAVLAIATLPRFSPPPWPIPGPPVSEADIDLWLIAFPRMSPTSPRREWYVRCWHVRDKINRAKAAGRRPP